MLRLLIAGTRGEAADPAPLIRAIARDAEVQLARPRAQGRGDHAAERGDRRRPHGAGRSRRHPRRARPASLDDRRGRPGRLARAVHAETAAGDDLSPAAKGARKLRTVALAYLAAADRGDGAALAKRQFDGADNMTARQGALSVLAALDVPEREAALEAFYERFEGNPLVIDKWFALQAVAPRAGDDGRGRAAGEASGLHHRQSRTGCARWSAASPPTSGCSTPPTGAATASSPT